LVRQFCTTPRRRFFASACSTRRAPSVVLTASGFSTSTWQPAASPASAALACAAMIGQTSSTSGWVAASISARSV
jgi:hypothetical protein